MSEALQGQVMATAGFTLADLKTRLSARGTGVGEASGEVGDHLLNPDIVQLMESVETRSAAVLVPVVDRPEGAAVILTQRTTSLRKHSGQIAFPGGAVDPEDASIEAAAMREAREEIDLDPRFVTPLARLPRYLTTTGFRIVPVLAAVSPGFALTPNPAEVADVFEVPLGFLMQEANHQRLSRDFDGTLRHFYAMPFGERYIWGVTAGILRSLYERLYA